MKTNQLWSKIMKMNDFFEENKILLPCPVLPLCPVLLYGVYAERLDENFHPNNLLFLLVNTHTNTHGCYLTLLAVLLLFDPPSHLNCSAVKTKPTALIQTYTQTSTAVLKQKRYQQCFCCLLSISAFAALMSSDALEICLCRLLSPTLTPSNTQTRTKRRTVSASDRNEINKVEIQSFRTARRGTEEDVSGEMNAGIQNNWKQGNTEAEKI